MAEKRPDTVETHSEAETMAHARHFGATLRKGDIVCLLGDLGAGKTHFVKGVAEAFGIPPNTVQSPTYTLINEYSGSTDLYHFDCYRLEHPEEFLEIGGEEYLYGEDVCIIEWPERIETLLPENCLWVEIEKCGPACRKLQFEKRR